MKKGIHLGPPPKRAVGFTVALVVLLALGVVLGGLTYRGYRDVAALRVEVREQRGDTGTAARGAEQGSDESHRAAAIRLRSVLQSGLLYATSPTEVLSAVASALPDGVILASLSLRASPPNRSLLLEAFAVDAERVTELQRRMTRSTLVTATRLLEERRSVDGRLLVRLQVDLAEPGP